MTAQDYLLDYCGAQARVIGDMIEPWKADHKRATVAHALDSMFPLIIKGCKLLRDSYPQLKYNLFDACRRGESVLTLGSKYYDEFRDYLEHCEPLVALAGELIGEGHEINSMTGAEKAIRELRGFFENEIDQLPRIRPEVLALSTEQYERGEYRDAREFFDELLRKSER